ncbi:MAG: hypothetical protein HY682_00165, partial [Chloroflexi bacterium]|nr:hypothetical protein [Chloroflexota bacterium]
MERRFYSLTFVGAAGHGVGVLVLDGGEIVGVDHAGVRYDGRYSISQGEQGVALLLDIFEGITYKRLRDQRLTARRPHAEDR